MMKKDNAHSKKDNSHKKNNATQPEQKKAPAMVTPALPPETPLWKSIINWITKPLSLFVSLMLGIATLTGFSYFPAKVDVSTTQTIDDANPMAHLLEIHNLSSFAIDSLKLDMKLMRFDTWNVRAKMDGFSFGHCYLTGKNFQRPLLRSNEYWTTQIPFYVMIKIDDFRNYRLKYADIELGLTYQYWGFHKENRFRLVGISDTNGKVIWTKQPLD